MEQIKDSPGTVNLKSLLTQVKVLIIDDSRFIRASVAKHLHGQYPYAEEEDGEAGWARINSDSEVRVVISDIQMPNLDGFGLLRRIRASNDPRIKDLPVIIISGSKEEAQKAAELGATEFITKSVGATELLSRLKVLLKLADALPAVAKAELTTDGIKTEAELILESQRMWSFSRRYAMNLVLISVRLDPLPELEPVMPQVRDKLVHKILDFIGRTLLKTIRQEDALGRLPDNEFVLAAMGISPTAAHKFAQRLLQAIGRSRISYEGRDLGVSASIGIATSSDSAIDKAEELIRLASERSRIAQDAGGQRVLDLSEYEKLTGVSASVQMTNPCMTLTEALSLIAQGNDQAVLPSLQHLMNSIQPLLQLAAKQQLQTKDNVTKG